MFAALWLTRRDVWNFGTLSTQLLQQSFGIPIALQAMQMEVSPTGFQGGDETRPVSSVEIPHIAQEFQIKTLRAALAHILAHRSMVSRHAPEHTPQAQKARIIQPDRRIRARQPDGQGAMGIAVHDPGRPQSSVTAAFHSSRGVATQPGRQ